MSQKNGKKYDSVSTTCTSKLPLEMSHKMIKNTFASLTQIYSKIATGNVTKILKNTFPSFTQIYSKIATGNVTKIQKKILKFSFLCVSPKCTPKLPLEM